MFLRSLFPCQICSRGLMGSKQTGTEANIVQSLKPFSLGNLPEINWWLTGDFPHPLRWDPPQWHRPKVPKVCGVCLGPEEEIKCFTLACTSTKRADAVVVRKKKSMMEPVFLSDNYLTTKEIQNHWRRTQSHCFPHS